MTDNEKHDVEAMVKNVMETVQSSPSGRSEVQRIANKDAALSQFQKGEGISDEIAEAAIKEWVLSHGGEFDWNLDDVKQICLRLRGKS